VRGSELVVTGVTGIIGVVGRRFRGFGVSILEVVLELKQTKKLKSVNYVYNVHILYTHVVIMSTPKCFFCKLISSLPSLSKMCVLSNGYLIPCTPIDITPPRAR